MTKTDTPRFVRINQSPRAARIMGSYALIAMPTMYLKAEK